MIAMHLDQVALILDLAQTHSFNQTAERHYTTQQSVSYSVKQLEKELNTKIFNRSKNGVTFTPEGKHVLQCAQQMQDAYQQLLQNLGQEQQTDTPPTKISVAISSTLVADSMSNIINAFSQAKPNTKLYIKDVPNQNVVSSLLRGSCDIAIWFINHRFLEDTISPQDAEKLSFRLVCRDRSIAVVSASSPMAQKKSLPFADINRTPKSIFGLMPIDFFGKATEDYVLYANDNVHIHQQLILEDDAICFTSETMYQNFFPHDKFVALPFEYPTLPNYHLILRRKDAQQETYQVLEDIMAKQLSQGFLQA
jgi:DNA-binding transcriptional LysR family regulator